MPPPLLIDLAAVDLSQAVLSRREIYDQLPQRFEFELLDGVCHLDRAARKMVAFADIRPDAWWVRGHVPTRPLLPGVLMLEMAAQSSALLAKQIEAAVAEARSHQGGPIVVEFVVEKHDVVYPMVAAGATLNEMIRRPTVTAQMV